MNRKLRMISALLALVMLLSCLTACHRTDEPIPPTAVPTTVPATQPTTEPGPVWPAVEPITLPEFALEYTLTDADIAKANEMIDLCEELSYSEAPRELIELAWENLDTFLGYIMDQVSIAQILYYRDLRDVSLSETYLAAYDEYLVLADRANLLQKRMYDESPVKDWFFEDWPDIDLQFLQTYTSELIDLQAQLNQLEVDFLDLSESELYDGFVPLYTEYVTVGNQIAKLSGFQNFYDYKSALTYSRDYGAGELDLFRGYVKSELIPAFEDLATPVYDVMGRLTESEYMTVAQYMNMDYDQQPTNYLQSYIDSTTGSTNEWFSHLFDSGFCIISDSANSYPGAFCTSFQSYGVSLCYFGPGYQRTSTVVHEMGHYYASFFQSDYAPFDLLETHSQANEALLITYMKELLTANEYDFIKYYDLLDKVTMILVCTMVDDFEQRIYSLDTLEGFTCEDLDSLIDQVCGEYFEACGGADYVYYNLVDMKNYIRQIAINNPCYYISYATSLVTTLNLFAQAEEDPAAAREVYRKLVEETADIEGYEAALLHAGAASPFRQESFQTITELFR